MDFAMTRYFPNMALFVPHLISILQLLLRLSPAERLAARKKQLVQSKGTSTGMTRGFYSAIVLSRTYVMYCFITATGSRRRQSGGNARAPAVNNVRVKLKQPKFRLSIPPENGSLILPSEGMLDFDYVSHERPTIHAMPITIRRLKPMLRQLGLSKQFGLGGVESPKQPFSDSYFWKSLRTIMAELCELKGTHMSEEEVERQRKQFVEREDWVISHLTDLEGGAGGRWDYSQLKCRALHDEAIDLRQKAIEAQEKLLQEQGSTSASSSRYVSPAATPRVSTPSDKHAPDSSTRRSSKGSLVPQRRSSSSGEVLGELGGIGKIMGDKLAALRSKRIRKGTNFLSKKSREKSSLQSSAAAVYQRCKVDWLKFCTRYFTSIMYVQFQLEEWNDGDLVALDIEEASKLQKEYEGTV